MSVKAAIAVEPRRVLHVPGGKYYCYEMSKNRAEVGYIKHNEGIERKHLIDTNITLINVSFVTMYTTDLNALQLLPCKVLGVHKQDGTEPFYTLQRLGDEAGEGQEIQTERHRYGVLLAPLYRTTSYRTGCLHVCVCVWTLCILV